MPVLFDYLSGKSGGIISKVLPAFLVIAIISMSSAQQESPDDNELEALEAVADSNLQFTNSLYKVLSRRKGNKFLSPIIIEADFALFYMGAGGETALQMAKALHLPEDQEVTKTGFNSLLTLLKSNGSITLEYANKIFSSKISPWKKQLKEIAEKYFHTEFETVDLSENLGAARVHINRWAEKITNNMITEMMAMGDLSVDVVVLANVIYFKGNWSEKFNPRATRTEKFFVTPKKTKEVQMMYLKSNNLGYTEDVDLDCQVLEIPYEGESLSMVVLLPNKLNGLAHLEANLPGVDFRKLMDRISKTEVEVSLPKFKIEGTINLKHPYQRLGITDIFRQGADFSGMRDEPTALFVVLHTALIEVDEEGAEAAAVPYSDSVEDSAHPIVEVNHPFLFAIVHKKLRIPIFLGRYAV